MNDEYENKNSDTDREIEKLLETVVPAQDGSPTADSDAQLMYAMGYAAGMTAAQEKYASPRPGRKSDRIWRLSTIAATLLAACFAVLLFNKSSNLEIVAVTGIGVDSAIDVAVKSEHSDPVAIESTSTEPESSGSSMFRSFFIGTSNRTAMVRRDQILTAAGAVDLDEALEQIASVGSGRRTTRKRELDSVRGLSPRSSLESLLDGEEFLGL